MDTGDMSAPTKRYNQSQLGHKPEVRTVSSRFFPLQALYIVLY